MAILGLQGVRGGTGVTSITAALAWALQLLGETVLAIDASPDNMLRFFFNTDVHHQDGWARALLDGGTPYLIDCSHFASEELWLASGAKMLRDHLAARGFEVETLLSSLNTDPWDFRVSTGEAPASASTAPEGDGYARDL